MVLMPQFIPAFVFAIALGGNGRIAMNDARAMRGGHITRLHGRMRRAVQ
jgi:hypothetical protein